MVNIQYILWYVIMVGFAHGYVYPILKEGLTDKQLLKMSAKWSQKAIGWVKKAFMDINEDIARDNAVKGCNEPIDKF